MKKIILIIAFLLYCGATTLFAQHHSYVDTTYYRYYQFNPVEWIRSDSLHNYIEWDNVTMPSYGTFIHAQYNYTDNQQGVEVAGIAINAVLDMGIGNDFAPRYAYLFDSETDTFVLKAQEFFSPTMSYVVDSEIVCNMGSRGDSCNDDCRPWHIPTRWYELYFDKPIRVYDSFYVGIDMGYSYRLASDQWCSSDFFVTGYRSIPNVDVDCRFPPILWKYYFTEYYPGYTPQPTYYPLNRWAYRVQNYNFMLVLPILMNLDSTAEPPACPEVRNLRLYRQYGDEVTLKWDRNGGSMWEVSRGPLGSAPGEGILDTVTSPQWRTEDSSFADTTSVAYVRTICTEYDTLRYSEWSRGVTWHGSRVGMADAALRQQLKVAPNPARDKVSLVGLPEGKTQVEVYDSRGALVLTATASPAENTVDISPLPNGCYLLKATNTGSTSTAKMVKME